MRASSVQASQSCADIGANQAANIECTLFEIRQKKKDELHKELTEELSNLLLGEKVPLDIVNAATDEIIIPANRKITVGLLRKMVVVYDHVYIDPSPLRNRVRGITSSVKHKMAAVTV